MIVDGLVITEAHKRAVRLLLWSLYDLDWEPVTASGKITAKSGARRVVESEPATYTTRCDRCGGDGVWRFERCSLCSGGGRREWPRTLAPAPVRLDEGGVESALLDALEERDLRGSYRGLEAGLARLGRHVNKPAEFQGLDGVRALRLLMTACVRPGVDAAPAGQAELELNVEEQALVEVAVAYLAWDLLAREGRIRVPGEVRRAEVARRHWAQAVKGTRGQARVERDRELKRLHRVEGWQVPALARRFGLARARVYEILYGRRGAA